MKKTSVIISALSLALVFTLASCIVQTVKAEKGEKIIYSSYNKAFYELTENVEKIDTALKKAALCSDSHSLLSHGADIRESAAFSISDLGEMDVNSPLPNINTFLNQSGDYIKAVAIAHSDGSSPTKAELDSFLMLSRFSSALKDELHFLREKIASGEISYSAALKSADETLGDHLTRIEKDHFSSYEPMNYEGIFSSHMENASSPYLSSLSEVTEEEALSAAFNYLYHNIPFVPYGETKGKIPSFIFGSDSDTSNYSIEITKNGGKLLYYSESRTVMDAAISIDEALFRALSFAENSGFPSLSSIFYENSGSILTVTLAPVINEVIFYTDIIEVEVAMDDGTVIGFNAEDYLMNHKERIFPEISDDTYDTISEINEDFFLQSLKKAFIPSEFRTEIPCLEALGYFNERTYLIYINAETGVQEEILLLSESDSEYFAK